MVILKLTYLKPRTYPASAEVRVPRSHVHTRGCPLSGPVARGHGSSSRPGADGKGDGPGAERCPRVRGAGVMVRRRDWEVPRLRALRPQSPFREAGSPACGGQHEGQPRVAEGRWDVGGAGEGRGSWLPGLGHPALALPEPGLPATRLEEQPEAPAASAPGLSRRDCRGSRGLCASISLTLCCASPVTRGTTPVALAGEATLGRHRRVSASQPYAAQTVQGTMWALVTCRIPAPLPQALSLQPPARCPL